jgi:hypothetical protein
MVGENTDHRLMQQDGIDKLNTHTFQQAQGERFFSI